MAEVTGLCRRLLSAWLSRNAQEDEMKRGSWMLRPMGLLAPLALLALLAAPVLADEVYPEGRRPDFGRDHQQDADSVTVDIGAGTMAVQMSTVVRIDKTHLAAPGLPQPRREARTQ